MVVLQVIPRQLCDNAGFDATDVLNKLRQKHAMQSGEPSLTVTSLMYSSFDESCLISFMISLL